MQRLDGLVLSPQGATQRGHWNGQGRGGQGSSGQGHSGCRNGEQVAAHVHLTAPSAMCTEVGDIDHLI